MRYGPLGRPRELVSGVQGVDEAVDFVTDQRWIQAVGNVARVSDVHVNLSFYIFSRYKIG